MTDEKKAIEQAMEAAVAELKAKGAAAQETAEAEAEAAAEAAEPAEAPKAEAPETESEKKEPEAEPEKAEEKKTEKKSGKKDARGAAAAGAAKAADKKPSGKKSGAKKPAGKKPAGKKGAKALKELARVRRNKIIGITAAVIAIMVGIFFIARSASKPAPVAAGQPALSAEEHGGAPEVKDDGTEVYPDGTVVEPDGTVKDADGNVIDHVATSDAPVPPQGTVSPGDANTGNVDADNGGKGGDADAPWSKMTDNDYQISMRRLNPYSGPFIEDQTDEQVTNVLALQFRNDGEQDVQYAEYVFNVNGTDLIFKLSNLPAGQTCVVLEANRHPYNANEVLKLSSRLVAQVDDLPTASDQILPVNNGDDTFVVMNLTGQPIASARVYFKSYYPDENTFIGGITYSVEVKNIPANGSSEVIAPVHYSSDYSMFVGSTVYAG